MELNVALDNFKRAYNDLITALEQPNQLAEKEKGENERLYEVVTDIGTFNYYAESVNHAKMQFRRDHGYNHIRIQRTSLLSLQTNVDNGKQI